MEAYPKKIVAEELAIIDCPRIMSKYIASDT
jgi:hypothetical protein